MYDENILFYLFDMFKDTLDGSLFFDFEVEFVVFIFENWTLGTLIFSAFLFLLLYFVIKYIFRIFISKEKLEK